MNVLELANVEIGDKLRKQLEDRRGVTPEIKYVVSEILSPVIQRLATLNPLWRFVATDYGYGGGSALVLTGFHVFENSEELGKIQRDRSRSTERIYVSNERIANTKQRSNGYTTADADKAVLVAKKMFFKLKPTERLAKAHKDADDTIDRQRRLKDREKYHADNTVRDAAIKFIMGTGFHVFLEHIKTIAESERNQIETAMTNKERLTDEMMTIDQAKSAFEANKTALVVKDGGKYLVKIGDKIDLYDDNTLPDWMRGKLGMLKLVQGEQFVSDTGCRVNEDTFVLLVEES